MSFANLFLCLGRRCVSPQRSVGRGQGASWAAREEPGCRPTLQEPAALAWAQKSRASSSRAKGARQHSGWGPGTPEWPSPAQNTAASSEEEAPGAGDSEPRSHSLSSHGLPGASVPTGPVNPQDQGPSPVMACSVLGQSRRGEVAAFPGPPAGLLSTEQ